jgi:hypothetical protein
LPCDGEYRLIATRRTDAVDVPREWDDIMCIARHCQSPFKVVIQTEQCKVFRDIQASISHNFPSNSKPRLLT